MQCCMLQRVRGRMALCCLFVTNETSCGVRRANGHRRARFHQNRTSDVELWIYCDLTVFQNGRPPFLVFKI